MNTVIELFTKESLCPSVLTTRELEYDLGYTQEKHKDAVLNQMKLFDDIDGEFDSKDIRHFVGSNEVSFISIWKNDFGIFMEYEIFWEYNFDSKEDRYEKRDQFLTFLQEQGADLTKFDKTDFFITNHSGNFDCSPVFCSFTPFKFDGVKFTNPYDSENMNDIENVMGELCTNFIKTL